MLRMIEEFKDVVVLSIRTGDVAGKVTAEIVNPDGLSIAGFYVKPLRQSKDKILVVGDVREIGLGGLIIDDEEKLMDIEDLIRMQELIRIDYQVVGKKVYTESGNKLGKVQDFAVDDLTWDIQKIYPSRSIFKDLKSTGAVIDRVQITEVTDKKIIVKDASVKVTEQVMASTQPAS
jgi:uncharacterized protein YrrD